MNSRVDTEINQVAGSQAAEGTCGRSAAQGSSAKGAAKALDGGSLCSHKKH